jgi:hypothetical protein
MSAQQKDSDEVMRFMDLMARLKAQCGGDPEKLVELAKVDEAVCDLCERLQSIATALRRAERSRQVLHVKPVNPAFIDIELWLNLGDAA